MDGKVTQSVDATQVRGDITFTWTPPAEPELPQRGPIK
jgi:hypothetical protein